MIPPKKTKREEAQPLAAVDASQMVSSYLDPIIEEKAPKVKGGKKLPANQTGLTLEHKESQINIKFYDEQIPDGLDALIERVRGMDPAEVWVFGIIHDKDLNADEIFEPSIKKRHIHLVYVIKEKDANKKAKRRRIGAILNDLGIVFRPDLDASIWAHRGVERTGDLAESVTYLTHETKKALREGKVVYDREEVFSNLDYKQIEHVRQGYSSFNTIGKLNDEGIAVYAEQVYTQGTEGVEWSTIYPELPPQLQKKGNSRAWLEERYADGLDVYMANHSEILRLCVYIQGEANQGKTYASKHAFDGMGLNIIEIGDGGKTGKYDRVRRYHDVMIIDDAILNDVLGMADNKACQVYRRGSNNQYFCGSYLIVTSNLPIDKWLERCNVDKYAQEAAKSRFYVCQVVDDGDRKFLDCLQVSKRGTKEQQEERLSMFLRFRDAFDKLVGAYRPVEGEVDYSAVLGCSVEAERADAPKGWFGSMPASDGQYKLPTDTSECLPF